MSEKIFIVTFESQPLTPQDASNLFLRAVGDIPALRDSMLGNKPQVFNANTGCNSDGTKLPFKPVGSFDWCQHRKMRKFSDSRTLEEFYEYLKKLSASIPDPRPKIVRDGTVTLLGYEVASRFAGIGIIAEGNSWTIGGWAKFKNPEIAAKILYREGFKVEIDGQEYSPKTA